MSAEPRGVPEEGRRTRIERRGETSPRTDTCGAAAAGRPREPSTEDKPPAVGNAGRGLAFTERAAETQGHSMMSAECGVTVRNGGVAQRNCPCRTYHLCCG
jgi:hypothetical protein